MVISLGALLRSVGIGKVSVDVGIPNARSDSMLRIEGVLFVMPKDPHLFIVNGSSSARLVELGVSAKRFCDTYFEDLECCRRRLDSRRRDLRTHG